LTSALSHVVSEIFNVKNVLTLKSGSKVIGIDMYQSATYDFLLTFHSNHGPSCTISEIDGNCSRKLQNFPPPVYFVPTLTGSSWNWVSVQGVKNRMMGLPDGQENLKIGLTI